MEVAMVETVVDMEEMVVDMEEMALVLGVTAMQMIILLLIICLVSKRTLCISVVIVEALL